MQQSATQTTRPMQDSSTTSHSELIAPLDGTNPPTITRRDLREHARRFLERKRSYSAATFHRTRLEEARQMIAELMESADEAGSKKSRLLHAHNLWLDEFSIYYDLPEVKTLQSAQELFRTLQSLGQLLSIHRLGTLYRDEGLLKGDLLPPRVVPGRLRWWKMLDKNWQITANNIVLRLGQQKSGTSRGERSEELSDDELLPHDEERAPTSKMLLGDGAQATPVVSQGAQNDTDVASPPAVSQDGAQSMLALPGRTPHDGDFVASAATSEGGVQATHALSQVVSDDVDTLPSSAALQDGAQGAHLLPQHASHDEEAAGFPSRSQGRAQATPTPSTKPVRQGANATSPSVGPQDGAQAAPPPLHSAADDHAGPSSEPVPAGAGSEPHSVPSPHEQPPAIFAELPNGNDDPDPEPLPARRDTRFGFLQGLRTEGGDRGDDADDEDYTDSEVPHPVKQERGSPAVKPDDAAKSPSRDASSRPPRSKGKRRVSSPAPSAGDEDDAVMQDDAAPTAETSDADFVPTTPTPPPKKRGRPPKAETSTDRTDIWRLPAGLRNFALRITTLAEFYAEHEYNPVTKTVGKPVTVFDVIALLLFHGLPEEGLDCETTCQHCRKEKWRCVYRGQRNSKDKLTCLGCHQYKLSCSGASLPAGLKDITTVVPRFKRRIDLLRRLREEGIFTMPPQYYSEDGEPVAPTPKAKSSGNPQPAPSRKTKPTGPRGRKRAQPSEERSPSPDLSAQRNPSPPAPPFPDVTRPRARTSPPANGRSRPRKSQVDNAQRPTRAAEPTQPSISGGTSSPILRNVRANGKAPATEVEDVDMQDQMNMEQPIDYGVDHQASTERVFPRTGGGVSPAHVHHTREVESSPSTAIDARTVLDCVHTLATSIRDGFAAPDRRLEASTRVEELLRTIVPNALSEALKEHLTPTLTQHYDALSTQLSTHSTAVEKSHTEMRTALTKTEEAVNRRNAMIDGVVNQNTDVNAKLLSVLTSLEQKMGISPAPPSDVEVIARPSSSSPVASADPESSHSVSALSQSMRTLEIRQDALTADVSGMKHSVSSLATLLEAFLKRQPEQARASIEPAGPGLDVRDVTVAPVRKDVHPGTEVANDARPVSQQVPGMSQDRVAFDANSSGHPSASSPTMAALGNMGTGKERSVPQPVMGDSQDRVALDVSSSVRSYKSPPAPAAHGNVVTDEARPAPQRVRGGSQDGVVLNANSSAVRPFTPPPASTGHSGACSGPDSDAGGPYGMDVDVDVDQPPTDAAGPNGEEPMDEGEEDATGKESADEGEDNAIGEDSDNEGISDSENEGPSRAGRRAPIPSKPVKSGTKRKASSEPNATAEAPPAKKTRGKAPLPEPRLKSARIAQLHP
ncbi:unnamed protein product [Peniophora sp. CBMAI 1063]|nr:unnamed protein product [Peniophora sp. CBMAI 1063]